MASECNGLCVFETGHQRHGELIAANANCPLHAVQPRPLSSKEQMLIRALKDLSHAFVLNLEAARDRIVSLGGQCDPVDVMERGDPYLRKAREAIASAESSVETGCSGELRAVCEEIRNKAQSSVGNYGLGNFVAIHRELLGSMCAILDRTTHETAAPLPIDRVVACLEPAERYGCRVINGRTEEFWAAIFEAFSEKSTAPLATTSNSETVTTSTAPVCAKHGVELAFPGDDCWACKEEAT